MAERFYDDWKVGDRIVNDIRRTVTETDNLLFTTMTHNRLRWYWKRPGLSRSWRVDETYVKVKGKWVYLCRAVDKGGDTMISTCRQRNLKAWETPLTINTDKAPTYGPAIAALKQEGKLPKEMVHRQVK